MLDLAAWLLRQINEDENAVRAMIGKRPTDEFLMQHRAVQSLIVEADSSTDAARFRLAECAAKRQVTLMVVGDESVKDAPWGEEAHATAIIKTLALPYADRPGYREEWKP